MTRLPDVRIVKWYAKLAYIAGVWCAGYPIVWAVQIAGAPGLVASIGNGIITLAGIVLGGRIFPGRAEPITPRRPWWKMTARRTLSRMVGVLAALSFLATITGFVAAMAGAESKSAQAIPNAVVVAAFLGAVAFLYLNSAAQLPRPERRKREVKFTPKIKLD